MFAGCARARSVRKVGKTFIEPTAREQHQQNGSAEVLNRILREKLLPTLIQSELPEKWWPEVLLSIVKIRNLSYSSVVDKTPHEAWYGEKPNVGFLRVIGTKCQVMKVEQGRKTLGSKTEECRLLGFQGTSIYRLLNANSNIICASDVVFDEDIPHIPDLAWPNEAARAEELPLTPMGVKRPASDPVGAESKRRKDSGEVPVPIAGGEDQTEASFGLPWPREPIGDDNPPGDPPNELPGNLPEEVLSPNLGPRVSDRSNKGTWTSVRFSLLFALLGVAMHVTEPFEPKTLKQAKDDYNWKKWLGGMKVENKSFLDNKTWTLAKPPEAGRKVLRGKWVYKLKRGPNGEIVRWKARWVVCGFEQQEGIDYNETFASVVKPMSYKAMFAIAAALDLEIHQMDVKTAFLYGDIDEEIYVEQPTGLEDGTGRVCKLNKALYGLKQSPRIWYNTLSTFLEGLGFTALSSDMGVFAKGHVSIAVYVDDLLVMGPSLKEIQEVKDTLKRRFEMVDLRPCSYYLGISVKRDRQNREIYLSQQGYIEKILRDLGMEVSRYQSAPCLVTHTT